MKQKQPPKRQMLFCEPCGFKQIMEVNDLPKLPELKLSPVQAKIPVLDPTTGKTTNTWQADGKTGEIVNPQMKPQPKKFKCPKCGRAVKLRELIKPFADMLQKKDDEANKLKEMEEQKKRLEDGKPPEKKIDPNFIG